MPWVHETLQTYDRHAAIAWFVRLCGGRLLSELSLSAQERLAIWTCWLVEE